jgi:hypothetical protein
VRFYQARPGSSSFSFYGSLTRIDRGVLPHKGGAFGGFGGVGEFEAGDWVFGLMEGQFHNALQSVFAPGKAGMPAYAAKTPLNLLVRFCTKKGALFRRPLCPW